MFLRSLLSLAYYQGKRLLFLAVLVAGWLAGDAVRVTFDAGPVASVLASSVDCQPCPDSTTRTRFYAFPNRPNVSANWWPTVVAAKRRYGRLLPAATARPLPLRQERARLPGGCSGCSSALPYPPDRTRNIPHRSDKHELNTRSVQVMHASGVQAVCMLRASRVLAAC